MGFYTFNYGASNLQVREPQDYVRQLIVTDDGVGTQDKNFAVEFWTLPVAKNEILVRFTNLADRFDRDGARTRYINVQRFAQLMLQDANKGKPSGVASVKIEELSLSGNMAVDERRSHHEQYRWKGEDDAILLSQAINQPALDRAESIALPP